MEINEIARAALLMAAQGDPKKAAEMEAYLAADPQQQCPAGGVVNAGQAQIDASKLRSTVLKQLAPDGIYLVFEGGEFDLYKPGQVTEAQKQNCIGVAVKLGGKSICVSLFDMASGEEITLTAGEDTTGEDTTGWNGYKDNSLDADADWDGKGNTEHLKAVGLNPEITLLDGQFIPSVAQWRFICLFRKELNQALAELGGDKLAGWYWTSTEYSAAYAWYLHLSYGTMGTNPKARNRFRVRAVSAFLPITV